MKLGHAHEARIGKRHGYVGILGHQRENAVELVVQMEPDTDVALPKQLRKPIRSPSRPREQVKGFGEHGFTRVQR